ncbi:hypothetical protein [Rickettsia hoogstraalii]|uniref:hypothetical protein n=1 Tax=Rickettsia hoogstraalii TaxID=467174 RepID=UPI0006935445|nr:hypothetical protein [Rickettsia hoogstraalii]
MPNITYILETQEKGKHLVLNKEILSKLSKGKIKGLAAKIFNNDLYWKPNDSNTVILDGDMYIAITELLYIASGINLNKFKGFINSLISLKDIHPTSPIPYGAAMLESAKEKILQTINVSNILSVLVYNPSELLNSKYEKYIVDVKDLALKRFCFLVANNEKFEISEDLEAELLLSETNNEKLEISKDSEAATLLLEAEGLLKVISFNNSNDDIYDNFKKYLIKECETYENFKKILDAFSDKIARIIQFKDGISV